jgi:putative FmdB family regulatory protein
MPLYEYQCEKCGDLFEAMQKFSDEPLTVHEKCGGPLHRLLSPPALQFKGSGWYITDYARGREAKPNGASDKKDSADSKSPSSEGASTPAVSTSDAKSSPAPASSGEK